MDTLGRKKKLISQTQSKQHLQNPKTPSNSIYRETLTPQYKPHYKSNNQQQRNPRLTGRNKMSTN